MFPIRVLRVCRHFHSYLAALKILGNLSGILYKVKTRSLLKPSVQPGTGAGREWPGPSGDVLGLTEELCPGSLHSRQGTGNVLAAGAVVWGAEYVFWGGAVGRGRGQCGG